MRVEFIDKGGKTIIELNKDNFDSEESKDFQKDHKKAAIDRVLYKFKNNTVLEDMHNIFVELNPENIKSVKTYLK